MKGLKFYIKEQFIAFFAATVFVVTCIYFGLKKKGHLKK